MYTVHLTVHNLTVCWEGGLRKQFNPQSSPAILTLSSDSSSSKVQSCLSLLLLECSLTADNQCSSKLLTRYGSVTLSRASVAIATHIDSLARALPDQQRRATCTITALRIWISTVSPLLRRRRAGRVNSRNHRPL